MELLVDYPYNHKCVIINDLVLNETKHFNKNRSISKVWRRSKWKTYAWDPITGIYLGKLKIEHVKSSLCKTPTIDGISQLIESQYLMVLRLLLTPYKNNSNRTKTSLRLRFGGQTTNAKDRETTFVICNKK